MKKVEVEAKVKRRAGSGFLNLNLNLPLTLADFFSILLGLLTSSSDTLSPLLQKQKKQSLPRSLQIMRR